MEERLTISSTFLLPMKYLFFFFVAFFLSAALMPIARRAGLVLGALDIPDTGRHRHKRPTVRFGGAGIFLSFFLCTLLFCRPLGKTAAALLLGGGIIFLCGVLDDTRGLSPLAKLIFQLIAALAALPVLGIPAEFSLLSFSLPLPPLLGCGYGIYRFLLYMNGVNFTDGIDGLCASSSIVALFAFGAVFFYHGMSDAGILAFLLLFCLLGFLPFNLSPASLFMGDSGAQLLGLSLAVFAMTPIGGRLCTEFSFFLALPAIDTFVSVGRRILQGKSPFRADRGHLHHLLLRAGLSPKRACKILVFFSMGAAAVGLLLLLPPA